MDDSASAIVDQPKSATSQKPKKRQRNKKANGKGTASNSPCDNLTEVGNNAGKLDNFNRSAVITANGITAKLEQDLHITGDGHQINGVSEKCNSKIDSHAVQNGHHTTSTDKMNNSTSAAISHTQQQQSSPEITASGALKKSKSKNKQKNKETNLENVVSTKLHTSNDRYDKPSSALIAVSTEAMNKATESAKMHLKNGFHGCINEHTNELSCVESQQRCVSIASKELSADKEMSGNTEIITSSAVSLAGTVAAAAAAPESRVSMNSAAASASDTCTQQQKQLPTTIGAYSKTTSTHSRTANQKTISNNTAKQNDDVANAKINAKEAAVEKSLHHPSVDTIPALDLTNVHIEYKEYESELQMHDIMRLIQAELSEPYSIYTYRYFIYNWPKLCFLAAHGNEYVGAIVCKLDMHMNVRRGYIAMLAVRKEYRKLKIGTTLVQKAIEAMLADNADEVVLETEMRNLPALRLYENLGFVRDKRLFRYYLNGVDALRLKLWFR